ncbi:Spore photoproduct lyase [bioreactor metagenome]|uniref:Spore photoproduct lyase n=1 Tax=bioreactor metagenome TaxID=1076179 RepID=A0A644TFF9_9ZZZZ|nr:spore photoproduct lyase [Negativicutes bacterium]
MRFVPKRAFFEPKALDYPLGQKIYDQLKAMGIPILKTGSHNRVTGIPGKTSQEAYREAKRTLVVGVRRSKDFAACKPSAHYQLPLNTSCPGMCEYCYLATTLGKKPYLRVYVNIDEILDRTKEYIEEKAPDITIFEGAATSDPIPTEYLTGLLKQTIEFFGNQKLGRFRFVTKFTDIDSLLTTKHHEHTRFRFSLNANAAIGSYEHNTPVMEQRVNAAAKAAQAGYPLGFIIAPIFYFSGWRDEYGKLFAELDDQLPKSARGNLTFELITHRFTKRAKANILSVFPNSALPMEEEERKYKYGQFGYGKYIYQRETMDEMKQFMQDRISDAFPQAKLEYFV